MPPAPPDVLSWVDEPRLLEILDIRRSTFLDWTKAGVFERDPGGAYSLRAAVELTLVGALRPYFSVALLARRWRHLRSSGAVAHFIDKALALERGGRYDLVVEPKHGGLSVAVDEGELLAAVRHPGAPRPVVVLDLAPRILLVRESFDAWATEDKRPTERRPGRPRSRLADVRELRRASRVGTTG